MTEVHACEKSFKHTLSCAVSALSTPDMVLCSGLQESWDICHSQFNVATTFFEWYFESAKKMMLHIGLCEKY